MLFPLRNIWGETDYDPEAALADHLRREDEASGPHAHQQRRPPPTPEMQFQEPEPVDPTPDGAKPENPTPEEPEEADDSGYHADSEAYGVAPQCALKQILKNRLE